MPGQTKMLQFCNVSHPSRYCFLGICT